MMVTGGGYKKKKPPVTVEKDTAKATQDSDVPNTEIPGEENLVRPILYQDSNSRSDPSLDSNSNSVPNSPNEDDKKNFHNKLSPPAVNTDVKEGVGVDTKEKTILKNDNESDKENAKEANQEEESLDPAFMEQVACVLFRAFISIPICHSSLFLYIFAFSVVLIRHLHS